MDLRTGKHVEVTTQDEDTEGVQTVALPGALVFTGAGDGALRQRSQGGLQHRQDREGSAGRRQGRDLAGAGRGRQRTPAELDPAPSDPARPQPVATVIGKCKPRSGARGSATTTMLVVAGDQVYACRSGKTYRLGDVTAVVAEAGRYVRYRRGEAVSVSTAAGPAGPAGLTLWPDVSLAPAPVSDPALGPSGVVYWLDGAQAPQMRVLTG